MMVSPARITKSNKHEMVPPIIAADMLLLLSPIGCSESSWHSLSSNEEITTVQLLSTLISIFCTGIVTSSEIHCSMYEASSELESLEVPWMRAR